MRTFEKEYPTYHQLTQNQTALTVTEIQQKLDAETALVEYLITDEFLHVFTITKQTYDAHTLPVSEEFFEEPLALRMSILYQADDLFSEIARKLHKDLFPKALPPHIKKLMIIPDELLASIPFEVLLMEDVLENDEVDYTKLPYLISTYDVSYAYSADLHFQEQKESRREEVHLWEKQKERREQKGRGARTTILRAR